MVAVTDRQEAGPAEPHKLLLPLVQLFPGSLGLFAALAHTIIWFTAPRAYGRS